jgi:hypothetical protein
LIGICDGPCQFCSTFSPCHGFADTYRKLGRNHELVEKIVRIAAEFDREPATPDEVRAFLNLKGKDQVGF